MTRDTHSQIRFYSFYIGATLIATFLFILPKEWVPVVYPEMSFVDQLKEFEIESWEPPPTPTPSPLPTAPPQPTPTPTPDKERSPTPTPTPSPTPEPTKTPTPTPTPTPVPFKLEDITFDKPTPLPKKEKDTTDPDRAIDKPENLNVEMDEDKIDIKKETKQKDKAEVQRARQENTVMDVADVDFENPVFLATDKPKQTVKDVRRAETSTSASIADITEGEGELGGPSTGGGRKGGGGGGGGGPVERGDTGGGGEGINIGGLEAQDLSSLRGDAATAKQEAVAYNGALASLQRLNYVTSGSTCGCSGVPKCTKVTMGEPVTIEFSDGLVLFVKRLGPSQFKIFFALKPGATRDMRKERKSVLANQAVQAISGCK